MLKLKIGDLVNAFQTQALNRLANTNLPIKTAAQLQSVLKQANEAVEQYDKDRIATCAKFGKLNPETNNYEFLGEDGQPDHELIDEFQKSLDQLMQKELTFFGDPFSLSKFYSSHSITASDLMILDWLFAIETDAQQANAAGN
jgi:hypothetical protein